MILDRVTITGADDSVSWAKLDDLSKEFPFVEWGILLSERNTGSPRFPSIPWLREALPELTRNRRQLSGHLCGRWVRDLLNGDPIFPKKYPQTWASFSRVQLNFHAEPSRAKAGFFELLRLWPRKDFIFQLDGVNHGIFEVALADPVISAFPLYDTSGGAGLLPGAWPIHGYADPDNPEWLLYCGYAGGLGPDNLEEQLRRIEDACSPGSRVWIDMERRVRSDDDSVLDLSKVRRVLEIASKVVA